MDRPDQHRTGVSPIKAFLVIIALIILATAFFLMTANSEETRPSSSPTESSPPDFSLTDEEAIARFEELYETSLAIYEERDLSLLPFVYVSGSSIYGDVQKEVIGLRRDGVVLDLEARTESLEIKANTANGIKIRHVVTMKARFLSEEDGDVTLRGGNEIQTIEWFLKPDESNWLVYSATIVDARPVK